MNSSEVDCWQGKTPHGVIVNVPLPTGYGRVGGMLPVSIAAAARHSLKGKQAGELW
jgi:hypothetical protein